MVGIKQFLDAGTAHEKNRVLFRWLSDDKARGELYAALKQEGISALPFPSRADTKLAITDPSVFHQEAYLLASAEDVKRALTDDYNYSNAPYRALGSGTFMLGLDKQNGHTEQREFARRTFEYSSADVQALAELAVWMACVLPLKQREFDLVDLAEQAALRFVAALFGFPPGDHALLEGTMRLAYRGLNYQILGRHFVSDPGAILNASGAMGKLLVRVAELIDLYAELESRKETGEVIEVKEAGEALRAFKMMPGGAQPFKNFEPIMKRITREAGKLSGNELAVIVVASIAGIVGNVQSSVSIAINDFFRTETLEGARNAGQAHDPAALSGYIAQALSRNPPAAFLPRVTLHDVRLEDGKTIPKGTNVILAMGAATLDGDSKESPVVFGAGGSKGKGIHECIGQHFAVPLITTIIRKVLSLEGLAETVDPVTGDTNPLEKLWGFKCEKYPLQFTRGKILGQQPLNVVMNIKAPVAVHAETLKAVIRYGAPLIEKALAKARHVHFAWFVFLEQDTKLALCTVYDGDFDAYIEHFALAVGPLFDKVFEHIEDAPPSPVCAYPKEFVDLIRQFNVAPCEGYFFSAYPGKAVSVINEEKPQGAK